LKLVLTGPAKRIESKGLFPLRLRVALRGVAWRAIVTSAMKCFEDDYRSPRNATRSHNGNRPLAEPFTLRHVM